MMPRVLIDSLLAHTSDHVYFKDRRSCFLYISTTLATCFGLTDPLEAVGRTDSDFFSKEHARQAFDDEQAIIRTGQPIVAKEEKETWPDGRVTWVSTSKWPLHDDEGNIIGTVGISRDITDHKQAEDDLRAAKEGLEVRVRERTEELSQAVARLEKHDRARSEFVANVSHELKTPLASMRFGITNLLRGVAGPPPEDIAQRLTLLNQECIRMLKTVEDILDLSSLEAGALQLHRVKTPFARLVRRSVNALRDYAQAKQVEVRMTVPDGLGFVDGDLLKLERVLINVAGNAVKFTAGGTVEITLRRDDARHDRLYLSVTDNGVGIAPHHIDKVTMKFYKAAEHVGGTGLGLYMARQIVELHGGAITIVSPPPALKKGTRVTITLPLAPPPTVLVADDAESSRARVAGLLTTHGYPILDCRSQGEALDVARQKRPDLVVFNFSMKGGMGGAFIALMKNEDPLHNLPILVLSDNGIDRETHEILRGYEIPVIQEPWTDASFLDGVDNALLNSNAKRGAP